MKRALRQLAEIDRDVKEELIDHKNACYISTVPIKRNRALRYEYEEVKKPITIFEKKIDDTNGENWERAIRSNYSLPIDYDYIRIEASEDAIVWILDTGMKNLYFYIDVKCQLDDLITDFITEFVG